MPPGVYPRRPWQERFWEHVDRSGECWLWTGKRLPRGYGQVSIHHQWRYAHRASWELHNGPIPEGMDICHRCDNPPCVNPAHLFLGTRRDNVHDMMAKGRGAFGDRHPSRLHPENLPRGSARPESRLTEDAVRAIRDRYKAGGISQSQLGREYGVTQATIFRALHGVCWAHVT